MRRSKLISKDSFAFTVHQAHRLVRRLAEAGSVQAVSIAKPLCQDRCGSLMSLRNLLAVAGAVIGSLAGVALLLLGCFLLRRRLHRRIENDNVQMQEQKYPSQSHPASQPQGLPPTYAQNYANSVMSGSTGSPYKRSARPGTIAELVGRSITTSDRSSR